jgi:AraC family transcriptional regulator, regulatory protein of adaptative response / methylated-DNA-[protein]-cysteine methyltransferase
MPKTHPKNQPTQHSGDSERWAAVMARDKTYDGEFFFSVATTGVYCRPSCPSRQAKRENVEFHATSAKAEAAGFRPCRRCRPDELSLDARRARLVATACRRIEDSEEMPSLDDLAAASGLSRFHFHRVFKEVTGVTPKDYARAHRHKRVRQELQRSTSVTTAIHDAGFNSSARFYADAEQRLGMTPKAFKAGGPKTELRYAIGQSLLGLVLVAASDKGVAAILIGDDVDTLIGELRRRFPKAELATGDRSFGKIVAQVIAMAETPTAGLELPLDIRGTAFQQRVWRALIEIPMGSTETYTEVAQRIGMPRAVRAVARACAMNHISLAVPCHRVVRTDGNLAGYYWGIERKKVLLEREAAAATDASRRAGKPHGKPKAK